MEKFFSSLSLEWCHLKGFACLALDGSWWSRTILKCHCGCCGAPPRHWTDVSPHPAAKNVGSWGLTAVSGYKRSCFNQVSALYLGATYIQRPIRWRIRRPGPPDSIWDNSKWANSLSELKSLLCCIVVQLFPTLSPASSLALCRRGFHSNIPTYRSPPQRLSKELNPRPMCQE